VLPVQQTFVIDAPGATLHFVIRTLLISNLEDLFNIAYMTPDERVPGNVARCNAVFGQMIHPDDLCALAW
jgi:hypothetical protein